MSPATRIASLLASATEMVCALGLGERLVGISHECDYPPEVLGKPRLSRPRFDPSRLSSGAIDAAVREAMREHGSVYVVDAEQLAAVRPDLVLTQAVCEVCAVPTAVAQQAVAALDYTPRILSLDAHDLEGLFRTVLEVGRAAGVEARAEAYVAGLKERVARVCERVAGRPRPRVLALEWLDPPFTCGHWLPEMVELAGGCDLFGNPRKPSYAVSWDALASADADVLVVMPCGFGLEASRSDAFRHAEQLHRVATRAIESGRAYVVDASSYFNRSGPRLVDGLEMLATLLHRELLPSISLFGRAARWP